MRTFLPIVLLVAVCAAPRAHADKGWPLYDGPAKPPAEVAVFNLWNHPGALSNIQIYTISIDGADFEAKGGIGSVPAAGGQAYLLPGRHVVRIGFVDSKQTLFPAYMDSRVFPGWYDIAFEAEAGKLYAPTLDATLPASSSTDRMCIGAAPDNRRIGAGLRAIRASTDYVACAAPSLSERVDRSTWCRSWDGRNARTLLCPH